MGRDLVIVTKNVVKIWLVGADIIDSGKLELRSYVSFLGFPSFISRTLRGFPQPYSSRGVKVIGNLRRPLYAGLLRPINRSIITQLSQLAPFHDVGNSIG